jgi:hypothetical protein
MLASVKDRIDGKRAVLSQARRIVRRAVHLLDQLGDQALAWTPTPARPPGCTPRGHLLSRCACGQLPALGCQTAPARRAGQQRTASKD